MCCFFKCSKFRVEKSTDHLNPTVGNRTHYILSWNIYFSLELLTCHFCSSELQIPASSCLPDVSTWVPKSFPNLLFLQLFSLLSSTSMNTIVQTRHLKSLFTFPSRWPAVYHQVLPNPSPNLKSSLPLFPQLLCSQLGSKPPLAVAWISAIDP